MGFTVAIVGRPNVGKSTLFNRLVGRRLALVDDEPGVTRDRRSGTARLHDLTFEVIDTAGLEDVFDDSLAARMRRQTERALEEANLVLLLIDARAGVTPLDRHFANWLRRGEQPVLLIANKCEGRGGDAGLAEAYGLGLGDPLALSAEHGEGFADLYGAIAARMAEAPPADDGEVPEEDGGEREATAEGPLQLAIVGRPNVGKSTLINRLLGTERVLTGPEAGITRDAIAIDWQYDGRSLRLFDTAGLRKKAKTTAKLEKLSAADTLRAIRFAQVVVLLLDAEAPMERQDLSIASRVVEEGRALVIALNKWDLCRDKRGTLRQLHDRLERSLPQTKGIVTVTLSALTGQNLDRLMSAVFRAYAVWNRRIATAQLNRWLDEVTGAHPPPAPRGRRIRLKYITQIKARPPTFALFGTQTNLLPKSYLRYLENGLRQDFDLPGTPLRIEVRRGDNPYAAGERGPRKSRSRT
jgi:GTP-binding protein